MPRTDYHIFKAIADTGSFATAADALNMTPSAVSKRLSRLEDRLGQKLMSRTTRSLKLTEKGEIFLEHCHRLVAAMASADQEASEPETELAGELRIRIVAAYASRGFIPILKAFQARFPRIIVKLTPDNATFGTEVPDIVVKSVEEKKGDQGIVLGANPWILCAAPSYLEGKPELKSPEDLRNHRCLCLTRDNITDRYWRFFASGRAVKVDCEPFLIGPGDTIHAAVRAGMGIARLAAFLVDQDVQNGRLIELLPHFALEGNRVISAFPADASFVPPKVQAFLDFCDDELLATRA